MPSMPEDTPDDRAESRARESEFVRSFAPDPESARRLLGDAIDELTERSEAVVARWVETCVARIVEVYGRLDEGRAGAARDAAVDAGRDAGRWAVSELRALRDADVSVPGTAGPLQILEDLYLFPTRVLQTAGIPPIERDVFEESHFPDDHYGLRLHSFHDLGPGGDEMAQVHLVWGASKAAVLRAERGSLFE